MKKRIRKRRKDKIYKRSAKECEEIIVRLREKLYKEKDITSKMRMGIYYAKKYIEEIRCELDGMYSHELDGSFLIVSKDELFDVIHNKVIRGLLDRGISKLNNPLKMLKEHMDW